MRAASRTATSIAGISQLQAPQASAALLTATGLRCERDGRMLFDNLDLEVREGDVVELTGPNGSGKTTLLRCLAGLTADFDGVVRHAGAFSYVGHRGGLNLQLTPLQNLRWSAAIEGTDASTSTLSAMLDAVGLAGYELTPCQQLSAGQQRRAALARLQFRDAQLWLLDEPLTALDEAGCALVRQL
ncbi:MAG TPA: heme ABC exporter ATP-binding protein CcmA, partial [Pseudomonadales bacterium]|nr:heme ABC exporter ATP-binding protein CcmA [Pseudomonadales bacterium]